MRNTLIRAWVMGLFFMPIACGGGGGGGSADSGGGSTVVTNSDRARAILERCLGTVNDTFLDLLDVVRLFPGGTAPPIEISDPGVNGIPFTADLDGDQSVDFTGLIRFFDSGGASIMPFTANDLMQDIDNLVQGLTTLPSGTEVRIVFDQKASIKLTKAEFSDRITGTVSTDIDGEIRQRVETCDVRLSFEGETALSILGVFPFLDAPLNIVDAGENTVAGTVAYQGTKIAIVEVTYNGVGPFLFRFDMKADTITPVS